MPGGYKAFDGSEGKKFSSTNQPQQYRGANPLTAILKNRLDREQSVIVEGYLIDENGKKTDKKVKVSAINPTSESVVLALLNKAINKGDTKAIEMIFDRIDGKVVQPVMNIDTEGESAGISEQAQDKIAKLLRDEK